MKVVNAVMPTSPDRIKAMMEAGPEGPIYMVNLLKFKAKAEYEDGRETNLTGYEAYQIYAKEVAKLLIKHGGRGIFAGNVTFLALGQVEELWDEVGIAMYQSRADMLHMTSSKEWRQIAVHRTAGLAGQLNIETVELKGAFG